MIKQQSQDLLYCDDLKTYILNYIILGYMN